MLSQTSISQVRAPSISSILSYPPSPQNSINHNDIQALCSYFALQRESLAPKCFQVSPAHSSHSPSHSVCMHEVCPLSLPPANLLLLLLLLLVVSLISPPQSISRLSISQHHPSHLFDFEESYAFMPPTVSKNRTEQKSRKNQSESNKIQGRRELMKYCFKPPFLYPEESDLH